MAATRLPPDLLTLLESAEAEAKRNSQEQTTVVHLVAALAHRTPKEVDDVFGEGAATLLTHEALPSALGGEPPPPARTLLESLTSAEPHSVLVAISASAPALQDWLATVRAEPDGRRDENGDEAHRRVENPFASAVAPDESIIGREEIVDELLALLTLRAPATPLLVGPAGCGKTAILGALASRLSSDEKLLGGATLLRLSIDALLGDSPVQTLDRALDALMDDEILAIDDIDVALALGTGSAVGPMFMRLRAAVEDPRSRLILIVDERFRGRLSAADEEFASELARVDVSPLPAELLRELAEHTASVLSDHHSVTVADEVAWLAAAPPARADERVHPGLLVDRLDLACAKASLRADRTVRDEDIGLAQDPTVAPLDAGAVASALRERVRGQDSALEEVAGRLALTRAKLDLLPDRPDGVFLLVGPTGVGKTELARTLCRYLFGSEESLIRLDMSEYAEEWALSRIIGPQPGYVGFTQPESWLTTRVLSHPQSIVLLDEIEKAHPQIWNAFLQVFDAGRLTDSRGNVANFSETIVLMTSNLGATAFTQQPVGFNRGGDEHVDSGVLDIRKTVERTMPPELINRLDGIIVFKPLPDEVLVEIAAAELERVKGRLAERGYRVQFDSTLADFLATAHRDPRYGARHVQRNIERLLLVPLASLQARDLVATVDGHAVRWDSA